jgi:hypothetical protein
MRKLILPMLVLMVLLASYDLHADPEKSQLVTMDLPAAVIADALKRVLPLTLNSSSAGLEGTLTVVGITNFRVKNRQILCHLDLLGDDLYLVTNIANQDIRLKLGTARMDFDCDVRIRFDAAQQTLFIRPTAIDMHSAGVLGKGDIGQAIMLLVNGRQFPVSLQNLKPVIAQTNDKVITIRTDIVDIRAVEGALQCCFVPVVSTARREFETGKRSGN